MSKVELPRVLTALVTPFQTEASHPELRGVDEPALRRLIEFQIAEGMPGLVPCGTTGESPTLLQFEHSAIINYVVRTVCNRAFVLGGTGSNATSEAKHYTSIALDRGVDGVLVVDPYYNRPPSTFLLDHYYRLLCKTVDPHSSAILIPYVIPSRTGAKLFPHELGMLASEFPYTVVGVKDATGDLEWAREVRQSCGDDFCIWSGDDGAVEQWMNDSEIAAHGVISVVGNIAPRALVDFVDAIARGDQESASTLRDGLVPLFEVVTVEVGGSRYPNPCAIKTAMAGLGMCQSIIRAPLGLMSQSAVAQVRGALQICWANNPSILAPIEAHYQVSIAERLANDQLWLSLAE